MASKGRDRCGQEGFQMPVHSCVARHYCCFQFAFVIFKHHTPYGIFQPNTQPNSPSIILGKALTAFALSLTWTACHRVHQSETHVLLYPWRVDSGLQSLSWSWISLWRHLLSTEGVQDGEVQGRCSHNHGPRCTSCLGGQRPQQCQYLIAKGGEQG